VQPLLDLLANLDAFLIAAAASPWVLPVLLAVCLVDGFFPPVPSEVVLLTAAAVIWTTNPQMIVAVVATATIGAWIGDNIAYAIGRRVGLAPLPWMRRGRSAAVADGVRREFHRRPESILLTGRFVPVARVVINMAAGAARLPYRRFLVLSLASATAWACVSVVIAVLVGSFVTPDPLLATAIAATIALVAGVAVDRGLAWRRRSALQKEKA
jgi:membrane protein DedA with SNARE-associated domain